MKNDGHAGDPMEILSKKWAMNIIAEVGKVESTRFNELLRNVQGINKRILSERLQELEKSNIVKRKMFPERPPRVEYSLTIHGKRIFKAAMPLMKIINGKKKQLPASSMLRSI